MAEGDSILRLGRQLGSALVGSEVSVRTPGRRRPDGRASGELDGRRVEAVETRGKHLLLHFSGGLVLHSHLGMKGAWHLYSPGERWRRPAASAWIALAGPAAEAVNFNGTSMRIVGARELTRDPRLSRLGPDILVEEHSIAESLLSLRRAGAETELGEALLDQSRLAGIGNIFKSEGCFAAGVDPWRPLGELSDGELGRVIAATRELMLAAAESGRQPGHVYRRSGRPCPRCGTPIESEAQGDSARRTYWCRSCQG